MDKAKPLFSWRKHWAHRFGTAPFLPMSRAEMDALGWDACDIILVTGDAYVDHPSFQQGRGWWRGAGGAKQQAAAAIAVAVGFATKRHTHRKVELGHALHQGLTGRGGLGFGQPGQGQQGPGQLCGGHADGGVFQLRLLGAGAERWVGEGVDAL
jgi:hypothetical protein